MTAGASRGASSSAQLESGASRDRLPTFFVLVAMTVGIAYVFLTPPLRVPDESAHFWRAAAIAYGHPFPTWYTPFVYLPQACAALVGRLFGWPPFFTFYLGRIVNMAVSILLVAAAMRAAPLWRLAFATLALLPTAMFEFASWSADAMTISVSCLATAMVLRGLSERSPMIAAEQRSIALGAFCVALCKPVYFMTPLLVWLAPRARFASRRAAVWCGAAVSSATAAGLVLSMAAAHRAYYTARASVCPSMRCNSCAASPQIRARSCGWSARIFARTASTSKRRSAASAGTS